MSDILRRLMNGTFPLPANALLLKAQVWSVEEVMKGEQCNEEYIVRLSGIDGDDRVWYWLHQADGTEIEIGNVSAERERCAQIVEGRMPQDFGLMDARSIGSLLREILDGIRGAV